MNCEIFTFAEGATMKGGQTCILHTFSNWFSSAMPAVVTGVVVVAQLRFRQHEAGDHRLEFVVVDADGSERLHIGPKHFSVQFPNAKLDTFGYGTIIVLNGLELYEGQHEAQLLVDGVEIITTPLGIQLLKAPPN